MGGRANPVLRALEEETLGVTNQLGFAHATGVQAGWCEEKVLVTVSPACRPEATRRVAQEAPTGVQAGCSAEMTVARLRGYGFLGGQFCLRYARRTALRQAPSFHDRSPIVNRRGTCS